MRYDWFQSCKMNRIFIIVIMVFLFTNCANEVNRKSVPLANEVVNKLEVPIKTIDESKLNYDNKTSLWTLEGKLFSGYAESYYPNDSMKQKIGILNGKKQNESKTWYPDGHLKFLAHYHQGKLHGEKKSWSSSSQHILISHLNYHLGKLDGQQKKWYTTGQIFKNLNLNMGKEEGIQQAYRKNGALFANYEARNGRIFGLKRAALCFELENEIVQHAD